MSRAKWKGKFQEVVLKNLISDYKNQIIKTNKRGVLQGSTKTTLISRHSVITSELAQCKVGVYSGKAVIPLFIDNKKVGHKFGEFVFTRRRVMHKKLVKNRKK